MDKIGLFMDSHEISTSSFKLFFKVCRQLAQDKKSVSGAQILVGMIYAGQHWTDWTTIKFWSYVNNYIHIEQWGVIIHLCKVMVI